MIKVKDGYAKLFEQSIKGNEHRILVSNGEVVLKDTTSSANSLVQRNAQGLIVSTLASGKAPFVVSSTDLVANLNANYLDGTSKGGLFTELTTLKEAANNLSITIGGTTKKIGVNYLTYYDNIAATTYSTVKGHKDRLLEIFNSYTHSFGNYVMISNSVINLWDNDSATPYNSSTWNFVKIGPYSGVDYGQWLLASFGDCRIGYVGRDNKTWTKLRWLAHTDDLNNYLPLTGGIIKNGANRNPLTIDTTSVGGYINFALNGTICAFVGYNNSLGAFLETDDGAKLHLKGSSITFNNNKVYHAGNDGSGSGLDSDLWDGKHWDDLKIGGRNYYSFNNTLTDSYITKDSSIRGYIIRHTSTNSLGRIYKLGFNGGGDFTVSFEIKAEASCSVNVNLCDTAANTNYGESSNTQVTTDYVKHIYVFTNVSRYCDEASSYNGFLDIENKGSSVVYVKNIKIERGTKATDWSPAPEDLAHAETAKKLQNPITLWGLLFDGSTSLDGSLYLANNSQIRIADNTNDSTNILTYNAHNLLALGYSSCAKGHPTDICGSPVSFRTGTDITTKMIINSSGGVTIGSSDLAASNCKLYVNGNSTVTGVFDSTGGSRFKGDMYFTSVGSGTYNLGMIRSTTTQFVIEAPWTLDDASSDSKKIPLELTWRGGYSNTGGLRLTGGSDGYLGGNKIYHEGNLDVSKLIVNNGGGVFITGTTIKMAPENAYNNAYLYILKNTSNSADYGTIIRDYRTKNGTTTHTGFTINSNGIYYDDNGTDRVIYHAGNFNPSNYLLLTGGTIKNGSNRTPLILDTTDTVGAYLTFKANGSNKTYIGYDSALGSLIQDVATSTILKIKDGNAYIGGTSAGYKTIWHGGNFNPSNYVTLESNQSITGDKKFNKKLTVYTTANNQTPKIVFDEYYSTTLGNWISEIISDYYGTNVCTTEGFTHGLYIVLGRGNPFDNLNILDSTKTPIARISKDRGHYFSGTMSVTDSVTLGNDVYVTGNLETGRRVRIKQGQALEWIDSAKVGCLLLPRSSNSYRLDYYNGTGWSWILDSSNYSSYALPLSGGTVSNNTTTPLIVNGTESVETNIRIQRNGGNTSVFGYKDGIGTRMRSSLASKDLIITDDGILKYGTESSYSTVYHSGNLSPITTSGGTIDSNALYIKKDLGGTLSEWVNKSLHNGPFEVGRKSNTMCVAIGVTDDDYGYIQSKGINITSSGKLVLQPAGGELLYSSSKYKIWHEGNDGSGSGLDADKLDGQEGSWYIRNVLTFQSNNGTNVNGGIDLNSLTYGLVSNYGSYDYWANAPTGMTYGMVLNLKSSLSNELMGQLAWDINHRGADSTRYLYWRANDDRNFATAKWHQIAFTDSNVASATKLQTSRTLWGRSFDGSANIGGNIEVSYNRFMSIDLKTQVGYAGRVDVDDVIYLHSSGSINFGSGGSNNKMYLTSAGNFGIGTTSPAYKLDVAGNSRIAGNLLVGADGTLNYIAFRGTTGDDPGGFSHTYIGENLWASNESSELVLYKGNDVAGDATTAAASGPDRIRHIAAAHLFLIYKSALSGAFSTICTSTVPVNILSLNQESIISYVTIKPSTNNTYSLGNSSYKWYDVYATTFNGNLNGNITKGTPQLCSAVENDEITIKESSNGSITTNAPTDASGLRKAIDFRWYNTHWRIGNVRGGSSNSDGFGVTYGADNLCFRVTTNGCYANGSKILTEANADLGNADTVDNYHIVVTSSPGTNTSTIYFVT